MKIQTRPLLFCACSPVRCIQKCTIFCEHINLMERINPRTQFPDADWNIFGIHSLGKRAICQQADSINNSIVYQLCCVSQKKRVISDKWENFQPPFDGKYMSMSSDIIRLDIYTSWTEITQITLTNPTKKWNKKRFAYYIPHSFSHTIRGKQVYLWKTNILERDGKLQLRERASHSIIIIT